MITVPQLDAKTTYRQWQAGEVSVVDVREQEEWDLGHIEGVNFLPLGQLQWRWRELDPDRKWVVVCHMGNRSHYAAALLRQAGYDASNMEGGMLAWVANELPITDPGIVEHH